MTTDNRETELAIANDPAMDPMDLAMLNETLVRNLGSSEESL